MTHDVRQTLAPIRLLIAIVDRGKGERVAELLRTYHLPIHWIIHGRGTAKSEMMAYLGLDEPEKDLVLSIVPTKISQMLLKELSERLRFDKPGHGIAFLLHPSSINAAMSRQICDVQMHVQFKEGAPQMEEVRFELIVAVVGKGYSDVVMDGARKEGATGGTVIRGRGLGLDEIEQFMNITIHPEKEIVLILVPYERKQAIMQAISKEVKTECGERVVSFSLTVDDVAGIGSPAQPER